ncbi:hypothetical protein ACIBAC_42075 [Streptomyces sp. NPDC051362]|uniref:hypothetical protein n=1 Tax=Streptomyces sp. NPDC051362 TaxID=3365651 RepID=UPI0037BA9569
MLDEDAEYWLGEVDAVLSSCTTPTQMLSLSRYLGAAIRAMKGIEQRTKRPIATTDNARSALAAAAEVVSQAG